MSAVYDRVIRARETPEQLAWGVAVGFFVAMTPTMGFQTWVVLPLAALLGFSKLTSAAGVWITNPVTAPFVYGFNYLVGARMLDFPLKADVFSSLSMESAFASGTQVFLALAVGGTVTGVIAGCAGYFGTLRIVNRVRSRRKKRVSGGL